MERLRLDELPEARREGEAEDEGEEMKANERQENLRTGLRSPIGEARRTDRLSF